MKNSNAADGQSPPCISMGAALSDVWLSLRPVRTWSNLGRSKQLGRKNGTSMNWWGSKWRSVANRRSGESHERNNNHRGGWEGIQNPHARNAERRGGLALDEGRLRRRVGKKIERVKTTPLA